MHCSKAGRFPFLLHTQLFLVLDRPLDSILQSAHFKDQARLPLNLPPLFRFLAETRLDKRSRLRELSSIVSGIRVFNWDCKRGGAGIEDIPALISSAMEATLSNLEATRIYAEEKAKRCYLHRHTLSKRSQNPPSFQGLPVWLSVS